MMVALGRAVVEREGGTLRVRETASVEDAVEGAEFVLSSIRVGGIAARTNDECTAIEHGYPGQETTGPAGMAMALRTVPVAVEQARIVHSLAPKAWLINFTNPAGLITQAIHASHRSPCSRNLRHAIGDAASHRRRARCRPRARCDANTLG